MSDDTETSLPTLLSVGGVDLRVLSPAFFETSILPNLSFARQARRTKTFDKFLYHLSRLLINGVIYSPSSWYKNLLGVCDASFADVEERGNPDSAPADPNPRRDAWDSKGDSLVKRY